MATYTPFASLLLAECLATDPFGTLHRAIDRSGHSAGRNVLVRRYHPRWISAGLLRHPADIRRNLIHLGHLKLFQGARLDLEEDPHFVWPLCQGRSLATVLEAAAAQHLPMGLDPALFLVWILCQHIAQLHRAGLPLGFLTPHRIWVGFDGLVELLDTPVITQLESLMPGQPDLIDPMRPYLQGPHTEGIAHDAYQMGALLFEILAHRPLPQARSISRELESLRMDTPDGQEDLPPSIRGLLSRMLGLSRPFHRIEELERELERALFDSGDFNPNTFGLAFSMHTLFRFEIEAENQALEQEQGGTGILVAYQAVQKGVSRSATPGPRRRRFLVPAAALLLGAAGLAAWSIHARQPAQRVYTPAKEAPGSDPHPGRPPHGATGAVASADPQPPSPPPSTPMASEEKSPHGIPDPPSAKGPATPKSATPKSATPQSAVPEILVKLRVFVDEQGRVRQTHIAEGASPGSRIEAAALSAARDLRLVPAMEAGKPVREWREVSVRVRPPQ